MKIFLGEFYDNEFLESTGVLRAHAQSEEEARKQMREKLGHPFFTELYVLELRLSPY